MGRFNGKVAIAPGPTDTEATRTVTPPEIVKEMISRGGQVMR